MGYFRITLRNQQNEIIKVINSRNLVPSSGLKLIGDLLRGEGVTGVGTTSGYVAFGERGNSISTCEATTDWAADGATDAKSVSINPGYVRQGNYSLDLEVDVSQSANTYAIFTYQPSASQDFSESGYSTGWVYWQMYNIDIDVLATTDALVYRIGSSSSDYVEVKFDKSDLQDKWNLIAVDLDSGTETGTVDWSAIDYHYFKFNEAASPTDFAVYIDDFNIAKAHPTGDLTDTILGNEFAADNRYQIGSTERNAQEIKLVEVLTTAEGNHTGIYEMAIFGNSATATKDTGTMYARTVLSASFTKDNTMTMSIEYITRL